MRRDLNELAAMLYPKAEDVVRDGFGGSLPSREVFGTAAADSDGGTVLVELDGDVEVDEGAEGGDAVFVEVPCSAAVRAGDRVSVTVQDGSMIDVGSPGWGDRVNAAAAAAATLAQEAKDIADAIGQFAWNDTSGTHVSTEEGVAEGTRNILLNSYGILLRAAANYLAALSQSGIAFYDGQGNAADNILASFGVSGAQVGRLTEPHIIIGNDGFSTYDDQNRLVSHIDSLGWWRYKPVDEYPDGDTSKPANPDYDPDHPSVLESFIGTDSEGLAYIFDKVVFGDWRARNVYDDVHDLWWPTPGRDVTFDVRSMEDSVLRLTATQYHEGQEPAPHGAEIEITSDGYINIAGSVSLGNSNVIYSKTAGGDIRQVMQINASNQLVVGYGGYNSQDVDTYVEGNNVTLMSRGAINMRSGSNALVDCAPTDWVYLVGSASGSHVRYCKRGGVVFVEVWYESGAGVGTSAKTLGTLPAGFRPSLQVETCAFGNVNNLAYLRVNPGGGIVAKSMSGTMNYFKGCISFPV